MVGIPMFADQPDNIAHMKAKGAAVEVNLNTMTSAELPGALRTVINDPLEVVKADWPSVHHSFHLDGEFGMFYAFVSELLANNVMVV